MPPFVVCLTLGQRGASPVANNSCTIIEDWKKTQESLMGMPIAEQVVCVNSKMTEVCEYAGSQRILVFFFRGEGSLE